MSQKFRINDRRLGEAEMELHMGSMFTDPFLTLNGEVLNVRAGNCFITAADGTRIPVTFQSQFMDRYPSVVLGEEVHTIGKPYRWFDKLALLLPFLLTVVFGFLGLVGGVLLWLYNNNSFKHSSNAVKKWIGYGVSTLIVLLVLSLIAHGLTFT